MENFKALKPAMTSGQLKVTSCIIITSPRVQLHVPKEESFPIPLKHIDVTRTTHTNLNVLQEKRINGHWNVDMDRTSADSWTGFMKFTLSEKLPPGFQWSGGRLTKIQATTRPRYLLPEIWIGVSEAAKKKEKQEWAMEKPKLDNARKLRGIYFIAPEDGEFQETSKNARKNLETPLEAAMPCKMETRKCFKELRETAASRDTHPHKKTKYACIVEAKAIGIYSSSASHKDL